MIAGVQHIALIVSKESNLWFYKLLGFKECFRKERKYDTAVLMVGHGMELEVFVDGRHPAHPASDEPCGLRHFALQVAPGGRLEDEIEELRSRSDEVLDFGPIMTDWTGVKFCFVRDPDGTVVEIRE